LKKNSGRIWPYSIAASIIFIFGACVATIVVTSKMPVENSDTYMTYYQDADKNANKFILARIAFDKKYKIENLSDQLNSENTVLKYRVTDLESNPIENAKIKAIITRPNNHKYDQELVNPRYENGLYVFDSVKLPQKGRWDIIAKINVDEYQRFYNFKADTRTKEVKEY